MDFGNAVDPNDLDRTRIVPRDDEDDPNKIERLITKSRNYHLDFWEKLGKEAMIDQCHFSPSMPEDWKQKFASSVMQATRGHLFNRLKIVGMN